MSWYSGRRADKSRPYKAPVSLAGKSKEFAYYIRKASPPSGQPIMTKSSSSAWWPRFPSITGSPTRLPLTIWIWPSSGNSCGRWAASFIMTPRTLISPSSAGRCTSPPAPTKRPDLSKRMVKPDAELGRHQVGAKLGIEESQIEKLLKMCAEPQKISDLMETLSWADRTKFRNKYLNPLIREGLLEMTIPGKPQSRLQRYRLTEK